MVDFSRFIYIRRYCRYNFNGSFNCVIFWKIINTKKFVSENYVWWFKNPEAKLEKIEYI